MPIRFRCPVCQQLLGIARRKAGSNVQCPNCHNAVLVPARDQGDDPAEVAAEPDLFDRDDFDDLLQGPAATGTHQERKSGPPASAAPPRRPSAPVPPPVPAHDSNGWSVVPVTVQPVPAGGIVLSPARATVLTVVVIVLLAAAFTAGLVIGRFVL